MMVRGCGAGVAARAPRGYQRHRDGRHGIARDQADVDGDASRARGRSATANEGGCAGLIGQREWQVYRGRRK